MSKLYFVTSNQQKYEDLKRQLYCSGIELERLECDFNEGRSFNIREITQQKLNQAKKKFPDKKLVVDDRGFFVPALNGFPGPFVHLALDSIGYKGIAKLMQGKKDRRAIFSCGVGYFDGEKDCIFTADEEGFIVKTPRGDNLRGWTELLYIYGHKAFLDKSLAELSDDEWMEYCSLIKEADTFAILAEHIRQKALGDS